MKVENKVVITLDNADEYDVMLDYLYENDYKYGVTPDYDDFSVSLNVNGDCLDGIVRGYLKGYIRHLWCNGLRQEFNRLSFVIAHHINEIPKDNGFTTDDFKEVLTDRGYSEIMAISRYIDESTFMVKLRDENAKILICINHENHNCTLSPMIYVYDGEFEDDNEIGRIFICLDDDENSLFGTEIDVCDAYVKKLLYSNE